MYIVKVDPGICGFKATIHINKKDDDTVTISIDSECESIKNMEKDLKEINCINECFSKFSTSKVYEAADKHIRHLACPIPCAIIKGIEAASSFAIPKDVNISIYRDY